MNKIERLILKKERIKTGKATCKELVEEIKIAKNMDKESYIHWKNLAEQEDIIARKSELFL